MTATTHTGCNGLVTACGRTFAVFQWNAPSIINDFDAWFEWALRRAELKLKVGSI